MRIAHVTATFPPYFGGTGNVCYHNTRVLASLGHHVEVFTADAYGAVDDPPGVTVNRLKPIVQVGNAPLLPQLLRLHRFDLVHLHYPFYTGAEFVSLARPPYIVTYHQDVELTGFLGFGTRLHSRTIGNVVLRRAARLCPTSLDYFAHSAYSALRDLAGSTIVELPNGVDTQAFQPGPIDQVARARYGVPRDAFLALFVGAQDRAHYFKGVPTLLRAVAQQPKTYLLLAGDGDLRSDFERLTTELGASDRIVFAGRVEQADLASIYRAADVLVLPSETRGEAFGMVLLEAMASGRPVIASDLPGVRSVVSHGFDGLLVEPANVAALAETLGTFERMSRAERLSLGEAGRRKVEEHYDWEGIGRGLEALYLDVLAEKEWRHAS
ncbi:MAG TPA: glycosyltransferase family 4 protein [Nitrolancea sp.]